MSHSGQLLTIGRDSHLFSSRPLLVEKLEETRRRLLLAPDQLLHPEAPEAYIVRRGKLRVTQFLPGGAEVTRAVLQAGATLIASESAPGEADPAADVYHLNDMVLMALGEIELWVLPPEALDPD